MISEKVGIIGLGYVGLPLALDFCESGIKVVGFDIDENKIELLQKGSSYISYIPSEIIGEVTGQGLFDVTTDYSRLNEVDSILITVPTPLNEHREPDLSFVEKTACDITRYLKKGQLVVLESTTYPGTTREVLLPLLERSGLKVGSDLFLAYSPERVDPNNISYSARDIPKVVGGISEHCLEKVKCLYKKVFKQVVQVSSVEAAEASKLLENIFRSVNIALVNEMKMLFDRMDIDVWEVVRASSSKPFGFMPFYPGPGLGGHCIPIDPFYLTWKAREYDFSTRFIELAGEINTQMPYYVVEKIIEALNNRGISIMGSKILLLGTAYKKNVDDIRESPALKIIELLEKRGVTVAYHDPYIPIIEGLRRYPEFRLTSCDLNAGTLEKQDCVVVVTDHDCFDLKIILDHSSLIIDTRNLFESFNSDKIVKA